jgi:hypothetical protein
VDIPTRDGCRTYQAVGWVIPWFAGGRPALVKVRQPDGRRPKYAEAFRDPSRVLCYPGPEAIRPGRPLVVVEGELDALALGEALGDLASVVTLGSASARPDSRALGTMLTVPRWFIATDGDEAGEKSAAAWPGRGRRVPPPEPFKDWSEARAAGVDLARWWRDRMAGVERPPLYAWPELSRWRWGGADDAPGTVRRMLINDNFFGPDGAPGIDNPGRRPSLETLARALDPEADPYVLAERQAIQNEAGPAPGVSDMSSPKKAADRPPPGVAV